MNFSSPLSFLFYSKAMYWGIDRKSFYKNPTNFSSTHERICVKDATPLLFPRFHFALCHYFLGHVACRNLPWQGLGRGTPYHFGSKWNSYLGVSWTAGTNPPIYINKNWERRRHKHTKKFKWCGHSSVTVTHCRNQFNRTFMVFWLCNWKREFRFYALN